MARTVEEMLAFYAQLRRAYVGCYTRRFQEERFSPNELDLLLFLSNNPSINTASQLCTCLSVSKSLVCRSVDSLTARGLLRGEADERDRRVQHLYLTGAAEPLIGRMRSLQDELFQGICQEISPEEFRQAEQTMERMLRCLQRQLEAGKEG